MNDSAKRPNRAANRATDTKTPPISRRQVLCDAMTLVLASRAMAGRAASRTEQLRELSIQMNWIMDSEYAGSYIASAQGYYRQEGIQPHFIAGGPNISVLTNLVSGKALLGISSPDLVAQANANGAGLSIIAAIYQKSPFGVMSLASKPVRKPADLIGKSVGLPIYDTAIWEGFLKVNGILGSRVQSVPVQTSLTPLISGNVDAWVAYATNEPIALELAGRSSVFFLFHDFGYPMLQQVYVVRTQLLQNAEIRACLAGFLRAEIRGWAAAVAAPELGARLCMESYGRDIGLNIEHEKLLARRQADFVVTPESRAWGLLSLPPAGITATLASLRASGLSADTELFDRDFVKFAVGG